ncbi:MAG TPA: tail fiber protein [Bacteroidia bacterium]|nr:tail fiber protein [Bacteroidia bacterium]
MDEYLGMIQIFAGTYLPYGYLDCDGSVLHISAYPALFNVLGTTYGGNGQYTFGLPDLRGCAPIGITGSGPGYQSLVPINLGQKGGAATQTLTTNNMPSHTHIATISGPLVGTVKVSSGNADHNKPNTGDSIATPGSIEHGNFVGTAGFNTSAPDVALHNATLSINSLNITNSMVGGNQPINTISPYLGVRFIICVYSSQT